LIDIIGFSPSGFCGGPRQALTGRWFQSRRKPFRTAFRPQPISLHQVRLI
jgi:hypothetical protein